MYCTTETIPEFDLLSKRFMALGEKMLANFPPTTTGYLLKAGTNLFGSSANRGNMYVLTEGTLCYECHGKILFYYEPGDLIGIDESFTDSMGTLSSTFAVVLSVYDRNSFFANLFSSFERAKLWSEYLAIRSTMLTALVASLTLDDKQEPPEIRRYIAGQAIINRGKIGDEVFTMLEGHADVMIDGVKVGEVLKDELFGVIAALSETGRTADVVSTTNCTVLSLPRDHFIHLLRARPNAVLKLVDDLSRTIVALNERVVKLTNDSGGAKEQRWR